MQLPLRGCADLAQACVAAEVGNAALMHDVKIAQLAARVMLFALVLSCCCPLIVQW